MQMPPFEPGLIGVFALLALHLCAVYTGLGAFTLAVTGERLASSKGKVFLKKYAQQMSALGLMFVIYMLLSVGGSFGVMVAKFPELAAPWLEAPLLAAPALAAVGFFTVSALIYALSWKSAKAHPGLHLFFGQMAAVGVPVLLCASLAMKLALVPGLPEAPADAASLALVFKAGLGHPAFAPLAVSSVLLAFACAGGFGLVYLLTRRKRDDFGRDYYVFVARFTARWAALFTALAVVAQGWLASAMRPEALLDAGAPTFTGWLMAGGAGCALAAVGCWLFTVASKTPMRTKPAMLLGALMLLAAVGALSAADATLFFAPQS